VLFSGPHFGYCQSNALDFDGINDFVSTSYMGVGGNGARTIEAWVKSSSTSGQDIITDWGTTSNGERFTFNLLNGFLRIEVHGAGKTGSTLVADGSWHHVAVTYDNTSSPKFNTYIDGILSESFDLTVVTNTATASLQIGARVDGVNFFDGSIDELRVWDIARTQAQIQNNMCDIPVPSSEANLTAYYKFDQTTGTNLPDLKAGNDGVLENMFDSDWVIGVNCNGIAPGNHNVFNLNLWLKANAGTSTTVSGVTLDEWVDQSLNANDGTQGTSTEQPTFSNNAADNINYNEVITFDGTSDYLDLPSSSAPELNENYSVFIVAQTHAIGATRSMYSLNHNFPHRSSRWRIESAGNLSDQWGGNIVQSPTVVGGQNYIHASSYDNTIGREMFFDGYSVATDPSIIHDAFNGFGAYVGAMNINGTPFQLWDGDIAEIIHFKEELSATERKKVNSYLAIKYGITIPNTGGGTQGDYLATSASVIWDADLSADYHNNVIGIGRDDTEALLQKQ